MPAARDRPAVRARRRGRITGDRPYLQRAVRPRLRIGDLQALHAEQHRRRILEHDARGFLMISDPVVRPKIVEAAGSRITAARRNHALSREPGRTPGRARPVTPTRHSKSPGGDNVPVNFEGPDIRGMMLLGAPFPTADKAGHSGSEG